ncbi:MAG: TonB-dependent receptor [Paludibacter sp.]|jgi:TonB-linked SusC/RagA family outer membrane protein|nr:TonB-dependent receptor [Paludibacter sp.]
MINRKKGIVILLTLLLYCFTGIVSAQGKTISIDVKNAGLEQVFSLIEQQSAYKFSYRNSILDQSRDITLKMDTEKVEDILQSILPAKGLQYNIASGNSIVITRVAETRGNQDPQQKKIAGNVTDEKGEAIIGANIQVKGSATGTITDFDGKFEIDAPANGTILISYIGYLNESVNIGDRSVINVRLKEDTKLLDEVVVVGYGTQKKVNLTGSVSMITADDLNSRPVSSVSGGLQGLLSGVTVVNTSGQPGTNNTSIRIRGLGTIGNSNPLVLVDGVEGDMSTLNPEDIQSVSVLKDAASASIYGARAANGVILVTTKRLNTKDQAPTISVNAYYGTQTPTRLPQMADAIEFMTLDNEARNNVGTGVAWQDYHFNHVLNGTAPNLFGNTDWISAVLNSNAPQQNYAVNVNGNLGRSGYLLSYRYFDQAGLTVGNSTGEQRHNLRFKVDSRLLDKVEISTNIGYTMRNVVSPIGALTSGGGAIYTAMRIAPNVPVYFTDGSWAYGGGNTNPVAILHDGGNTRFDADEMSLMSVAKIDILKGWDISATYSIVNRNSLTQVLRKSIMFTNPETPETPLYIYNNPNSLNNSDARQRQQTFILQSNFEFDIDKHKISGVGGFSQEWSVLRQFEGSRINLITEQDPTLNLGSKEGMSNNGGASQWAIRSGFGRLNYNYNDRYLMEVNLRYDLSSRFHKSNRAGLFPSFSGAWRLSEESFMKFSKDFLDNVKLRASWGMLGNQYVGSTDYPYLSVLTEVNGLSAIGTQGTTGYTQTTLANPLLTWEKIDMLDIGLDITLLKNRLSITFDWYNKNTNDILLRLNYPSQIGASPSEQNVGSVNNRGWEIDLSWRDKIGKLSYGLSFNLSDVQNKITDLGDTSPDMSSYLIRRVGDPIDAFYGYIAEGLMTPDDFTFYDDFEQKYFSPKVPVVMGPDYQPGDIKYKDISGPQGIPDGRISPEYDRVVLGSAIPRYTYSFKTDLMYQHIDFSFSLQGVGRADGYLTGTARHAFQDMAAYPQKIHLERYNVVSNPDPNAAYPRLTYNTDFNQSTFSTFWLENAAYLRLKNVQLGYTLPAEITKKAKIEKCRFYVSGDNLLTLSNFFYAYDPETPISRGGYYPQIKTFVVGVNLTFQ